MKIFFVHPKFNHVQSSGKIGPKQLFMLRDIQEKAPLCELEVSSDLGTIDAGDDISLEAFDRPRRNSITEVPRPDDGMQVLCQSDSMDILFSCGSGNLST